MCTHTLFALEAVAAVDEADLCILKNLECCISERGAPASAELVRGGMRRHGSQARKGTAPKLSETERRLYVQAR